MRRRHIIQNNDDMKFIGLDGFEEIESLFPEKKSAAPLKAKAPNPAVSARLPRTPPSRAEA